MEAWRSSFQDRLMCKQLIIRLLSMVPFLERALMAVCISEVEPRSSCISLLGLGWRSTVLERIFSATSLARWSSRQSGSSLIC